MLDSFDQDRRSFDEELARMPNVPAEPKGFLARFGEDFDAARELDNSFYGTRARYGWWERALDQLYERTGQRLPNPMAQEELNRRDPNQPQTLRIPFGVDPQVMGGVDTRSLAEKAATDALAKARELHPDLPDPEAMRGDIAARERTIRRGLAESERVSTTGGDIGGFAGGMAGALTDPVNLAILPLGAPAATSILRAAIVEGVLGLTSQAAIEAINAPFRREIGTLDLGRSLENVLGAGAGAAVLGGGLRSLGPLYRRVFSRARNLDEGDALRVAELQDHVTESNPLGPARYDEHAAAYSRAVEDVVAGERVEPLPLFEAAAQRVEPPLIERVMDDLTARRVAPKLADVTERYGLEDVEAAQLLETIRLRPDSPIEGASFRSGTGVFNPAVLSWRMRPVDRLDAALRQHDAFAYREFGLARSQFASDREFVNALQERMDARERERLAPTIERARTHGAELTAGEASEIEIAMTHRGVDFEEAMHDIVERAAIQAERDLAKLAPQDENIPFDWSTPHVPESVAGRSGGPIGGPRGATAGPFARAAARGTAPGPEPSGSPARLAGTDVTPETRKLQAEDAQARIERAGTPQAQQARAFNVERAVDTNDIEVPVDTVVEGKEGRAVTRKASELMAEADEMARVAREAASCAIGGAAVKGAT